MKKMDAGYEIQDATYGRNHELCILYSCKFASICGNQIVNEE
jgi:hypothetical protein